jgi:hypothetical protein
MLMLVSGHTFDVDPGLGILVALKPLKSPQFIGKFESHAKELLHSQMCHTGCDGEGRLGNQLFVKRPRRKDGMPVIARAC